MAALAAVLPAPVHAIRTDIDDEEEGPQLKLAPKRVIPVYGQRRGWRPTAPEDFGDGGAYPECHVAQYPLDMGRKKVSIDDIGAVCVSNACLAVVAGELWEHTRVAGRR